MDPARESLHFLFEIFLIKVRRRTCCLPGAYLDSLDPPVITPKSVQVNPNLSKLPQIVPKQPKWIQPSPNHPKSAQACPEFGNLGEIRCPAIQIKDYRNVDNFNFAAFPNAQLAKYCYEIKKLTAPRPGGSLN